eukprot:TRINITY_DN3722_c0_g1_i1.p1 TRINITY_DN3722_c0_g1~~TRINITY_DN3722_c0_g1_i1.p1  ORF type:complete len:560 (+),score=231.80 TRINITY_DN3722_c0_g1_i1:247-1680(+)
MTKDLKKFLKKNVVKSEELAIADAKLGNLIKEDLSISCVHNNVIEEVYRGLRAHMQTLLEEVAGEKELNAMVLGLSHSICRYKLKFSPDKVDTMIIQAIALLDELDKELNTYAMRVREWYGWHFPELTKILTDNMQYAQVVKKIGFRKNASKSDLSDVLPEELEQQLKEAAEISMGTDISDEDILNVQILADQVLNLAEYRSSLFQYLKDRMNAIAPNLTLMVGELVGARLIAHSGSLLSLAKHPASTVQILGAEKALFRALKTKHATPKYGLIFHASIVGQSSVKNKGKISRVLAAKTALAARVDALGEGAEGPTLGFTIREKVESRLRQIEGQHVASSSKGKVVHPSQKKHVFQKDSGPTYDDGADVVMKIEDGDGESKPDKKLAGKKRKAEKDAASSDSDSSSDEDSSKKSKKKDKKKKDKKKDKKKVKKESSSESDSSSESEDEAAKKKKKKNKDKKKPKKQKTEDNNAVESD